MQEIDHPHDFKARNLNKKILDRPADATPFKEKQLTEPAPFQFMTDERQKLQVKTEDGENSKPGSVVFKAKAMPKYKFFQVQHSKDSAKKLSFKEFNLATAGIKRVRSTSHEAEQSEEHQFHAQPMPDFSKPKSCVKKDSITITKAEGFKLSTIERGEEKKAKFM